METIIDWRSEQSHLLLNPAVGRVASLRLDALPHLRGHIWLATSGSSARRDEVKLVALGKEAFLVSAAAVNSHAEVQASDSWFLALPDFHVGGLSIHARATLSSSSIKRWPGIDRKWNVEDFYRDLSGSGCSLLSLVPTQVWDLVNARKQAPLFLRAAFVGGGALTPDLYSRGRLLGWPLLPSYGLTECCSQVATAPISSLQRDESPGLQILSHIAARVESDEKLSLKSQSLLTGVAHITAGKIEFYDPKIDGWFHTEDVVAMTGNSLTFRARSDDLIKINGKKVSQLALQNILDNLIAEFDLPLDVCLLALEDPRRGYRIALAVAAAESSLIATLTEKFNQQVLPHERVKESYLVSHIPRTPLGKIRRRELVNMLT